MENIQKVPKLKPPLPIFERSSDPPKIFKKIFIHSQNFSGDFISPRTLLPPGNFHFFTRFQDGFGTQFPPSNHTHTNRSPKRVKSHPPTQHFVVIGGLYREDIFPWILLISSGRSQPPPPCIQVAKEPGSARL